MIAAWSFSVVLATVTYSGPCASCEASELQMEAWREHQELYFDPSPANREAVSHRMVDRILVPLRSPAQLIRESWNCLQLDDGDPEILSKALSDEADFFHDERERLGLGAQRAVIVALEKAERQARDESHGMQYRRNTTLAPGPSLPEIRTDPCPEQRDEASRFRKTLAAMSTRMERLDAALNLASAPATDSHEDPSHVDRRLLQCNRVISDQARSWAIHEITAARDPREWDPTEIAHLVLSARRSSGDRLSEVTVALKPIGLIRETELLVGPVDRAQFQTFPRDPGWRHFECEESFYRAEWDAKRRDELPSRAEAPSKFSVFGCFLPWPLRARRATVQQLERRNGEAELQRYLGERWLETDEKAPHPDMEAVRAALTELARENDR